MEVALDCPQSPWLSLAVPVGVGRSRDHLPFFETSTPLEQLGSPVAPPAQAQPWEFERCRLIEQRPVAEKAFSAKLSAQTFGRPRTKQGARQRGLILLCDTHKGPLAASAGGLSACTFCLRRGNGLVYLLFQHLVNTSPPPYVNTPARRGRPPDLAG